MTSRLFRSAPIQVLRSAFWPKLVLIPLLMLLAVPTEGRGQNDGEVVQGTEVTIASAGVRRYEPGAWSTLAINATNKSGTDSEELVSVFLGKGNSNRQFARRFWLPAGSRLQTFLPILIPETRQLPPDQVNRDYPQVDVHYMRLSETNGAEAYRGDPGDTNIPSQPLRLDYEQSKTGILFRRDMPGDPESDEPEVDLDTYETVYKARGSALSSRVLIEFGGDFIPPHPTALNSLDQMVISGDRLLNDSVGLANLRHWLQRGGRIWITLDTTSMETVRALLGNEARCSVVDRVELNEFQLEDLGDAQRLSAEPAVESWSSEIPVDMVRVLAGTEDIHCRIDGWPVAFWQKVGDGEVLFTTLGPRGWLDDETPTSSLSSIARRFFQQSEERTLDPAIIEPLLNDQIGYRIPSRSLAAWVLGLNFLAILSFGCWWARQRCLERLAWFVPLVVLASTATFLVIGSRNTVAVPSTVATEQIVRVFNASHESQVTALSAVYAQEPVDLGLAARNGSQATILDRESLGSIQRMVWDDSGASHSVNLHQPPGVVRTIESRRVVSHRDPPVVHGTFDANGFQGTLAGIDIEQCEDAVIVAPPAHASAVALDSLGAFHVDTGDVLAAGQYIADGLLSDKQRSRQQQLRQLLASSLRNPFGSEPTLLVWTPPLDVGIAFNAKFDELGSALISIPLQLERPAPGVAVQIPATFIRIKSFSGRQGASSMFNQRTGAWIQNAMKPTRSQLRCVVPKALAPLKLRQATVTIKINAPSRSLRIEGLVDGTSTMLHELDNPNGVLRLVIDRPEVLELDADGGFHLAIVVTETVEERTNREAGQDGSDPAQFTNSTWQIDYVRVDVEGTVQ